MSCARSGSAALGIVFISHFLDQIFEITDRVTVLRNGRLVGTEATRDIDRVRLVNLMLGRELEQEVRSHGKTHAGAGRGGAARLTFTGFGRKGSIEPFDLSIQPGEVVGVAGLLGSGRTETAEALFGRGAP